MFCYVERFLWRGCRYLPLRAYSFPLPIVRPRFSNLLNQSDPSIAGRFENATNFPIRTLSCFSDSALWDMRSVSVAVSVMQCRIGRGLVWAQNAKIHTWLTNRVRRLAAGAQRCFVAC